MNEAKKQRVAEADHQRVLKRARETNALSVALLRALSAREILFEEVASFTSGEDNTPDKLDTAVHDLVVNRAFRLDTMRVLFHASLHVVVEGWLDPKQASPRLADAKIDALLASDSRKLLADARNLVMHPNPLGDPRFQRLVDAQREMLPWVYELCSEFRRFFLDWRRSLNGRT